MTLRLLADENVDHRVMYRLAAFGLDVEHVDLVPELGKGTDDERIARYSLETGRPILTNDDDFLTEFDDGDYRGILFVEDDTLSSREIADIVHAIAGAVDQEQIETVFYVSSSWLP